MHIFIAFMFKKLLVICLFFNGKQVPIKESAKHIGLYLTEDPIKGEIAISKSRKTIYALMGTGVHAKNGINPIISRRIWERYSLPRSTFGMDIQIVSDTDQASQEQQSLPLDPPKQISSAIPTADPVNRPRQV